MCLKFGLKCSSWLRDGLCLSLVSPRHSPFVFGPRGRGRVGLHKNGHVEHNGVGYARNVFKKLKETARGRVSPSYGWLVCLFISSKTTLCRQLSACDPSTSRTIQFSAFLKAPFTAMSPPRCPSGKAPSTRPQSPPLLAFVRVR